MLVNQNIMPTTARINEKGHLEIGGCDTVELANQYSTPLYIYDEESIRQSCKQYNQAFSKYENFKCLYASKAFMTKAMCFILKQENFGLDVVSGGEIYTAVKSDFPMENVFFNGNNKSVEELTLALDSGIGRITVDNFFELELLNKIAVSKGKTVNILLRITPGIECHTHEYIQTGHLDSKFGFDLTQLPEAIKLIVNEHTNLCLKGLHGHIGSQIFETKIFPDLIDILFEEFEKIKQNYNLILEEMNIGGGLGIKYTESDNPPPVTEIANLVIEAVENNLKKYELPKPKLFVEPGRSISGTSGVTIYKAGSSKQVPKGKKYIAVDGGMSDNPRPSMYQAEYKATLANRMNDKQEEIVTIAGRYCESGDILIKDIALPKINAGDFIAVFNTGAYNYSMASNYNRVEKPAAVLVKDGQSDIIVKRETYENLVEFDEVPERFCCLK